MNQQLQYSSVSIIPAPGYTSTSSSSLGFVKLLEGAPPLLYPLSVSQHNNDNELARQGLN
jgi:hypothetical protein